MFLKTLVVRMMAVFALMGILIGATPSQAAEKKSYTSKEPEQSRKDSGRNCCDEP